MPELPDPVVYAVRAHQHHPPFGIADDRGKARAVARDLDPAKPRFGLFGEADRVGFVRNPRIGAEPHLADQPGNEQDDDERCARLDEHRRHFSPESASSIGRRPLRS